MKENSLQINRHTIKYFTVCAISVVCLVAAIVYAMDIKDLLWANENGKDMSETVSYLDTLYNPQTTYRPSTDVMVSGILRFVVMLIAIAVFVKYIIDRKSTVLKTNTLAVLLIAANIGTLLMTSSNIMTSGFYISIAANVIFAVLSICFVINNYSQKSRTVINVLLAISILAAILSLIFCDIGFRIIEPICSFVIALGCYCIMSEKGVLSQIDGV